ncbi:MAG: peptide-methionine (R)-S-oxide reductase MsrB [Hyphomonadaceae bacterium]
MKPAPLIAAAALALIAGAGAFYFAGSPVAVAQQRTFEQLRAWVMDQRGTEPAFNNAYWDNHQPGLYVEARTGEALFVSTDKYDSGSGWPSFTRPVDPNAITMHEDNAFGMRRIEVRSRRGGAHLGHVFDDGPRGSGGQRFCINSCAIRFIPRDRMQAEGYGRYIALVDAENAPG